MINPASRAFLSNYRAFRKLAAVSQLNLNAFHAETNRIGWNEFHCKKYHVLVSNIILRNTSSHYQNGDTANACATQQSLGCNRLNKLYNNCGLSRNILTKNNANIHICRKKQKLIFHNGVSNPWGSPFAERRQFSLNPKDILEASPKSMQPYMRLIRFDKPIGTYLLFWPCTWSIGLAAEAGHLPNLYILTLFGLGSFFMRGAGCIINDMWDKEIDKRVERTKTRPLASGELSQFQALCMLAVNLSLSLGILLQLNMYSVILGASSMSLVILYPLAKRYTYWPQFVLGLTFNYGAMLGWTAVRGAVDWPILPLYISCLLWTLIYDTIYAHQDKYDDMLVGVKSTALKLGDKTKPWLMGFSALMLSGLTMAGQLCDQTWPYYLAVTATGAHLWYQLSTVDLNNPDDCFAKFRSNSWLGVVMFTGIVAGTLLKEDKKVEDMEMDKKSEHS